MKLCIPIKNPFDHYTRKINNHEIVTTSKNPSIQHKTSSGHKTNQNSKSVTKVTSETTENLLLLSSIIIIIIIIHYYCWRIFEKKLFIVTNMTEIL